METTVDRINSKDVRKLMEDVALIKRVLSINRGKDPEGELTLWAKKELKKARKEPESSYTSHEEIRKRMFSKK